MRLTHNLLMTAVVILAGGCTQFERDNPLDPNGTSFRPDAEGNLPPNEPHQPIPGPDAGDVPIGTLVLQWACSDPDGDALQYKVFVGRTDQFELHITPWRDANDLPLNNPQLQPATTYFWRINAKDEHGAITEGPVWRFTTEAGSGNMPPDEPTNPTPPHMANNVAVNAIMLRWDCTDPNMDPLEYRVFMGTNDPPALKTTGWRTVADWPVVGDLMLSTTYYWKIEARDSNGATRMGPLWQFTTRPGL